MGLCLLPPPKAAPQGAACCGTPTGHPWGKQAWVGGCSSTSGVGGSQGSSNPPSRLWLSPQCRQVRGTSSLQLRGKGSQAPWEMGQQKAGSSRGDTRVHSPALGRAGATSGGWKGARSQLAAPQQEGWRIPPRSFAIAGWGQSARLGLRREGGCRGRKQQWRGILFRGSGHPSRTRPGRGRSAGCKGEVGSLTPAGTGFPASEVLRRGKRCQPKLGAVGAVAV